MIANILAEPVLGFPLGPKTCVAQEQEVTQLMGHRETLMGAERRWAAMTAHDDSFPPVPALHQCPTTTSISELDPQPDAKLTTESGHIYRQVPAGTELIRQLAKARLQLRCEPLAVFGLAPMNDLIDGAPPG